MLVVQMPEKYLMLFYQTQLHLPSLFNREIIPQKEGDNKNERKKKKDIAEMVKTAKYLAKNDPQSFMLARNTVDVLKARADMDVKAETKSNKEE